VFTFFSIGDKLHAERGRANMWRTYVASMSKASPSNAKKNRCPCFQRGAKTWIGRNGSTSGGLCARSTSICFSTVVTFCGEDEVRSAYAAQVAQVAPPFQPQEDAPSSLRRYAQISDGQGAGKPCAQRFEDKGLEPSSRGFHSR
jgi:hypothetical protein